MYQRGYGRSKAFLTQSSGQPATRQGRRRPRIGILTPLAAAVHACCHSLTGTNERPFARDVE